MFNSDPFDLPDTDITEDTNPTYVSVDLNQDGIDESYTESYDRDGDGHYDLTILEADNDGDGIAETTTAFDDIDIDGDGTLDQTLITVDIDNDGNPDFEDRVVYIDYETDTLIAANSDAACVVGNLGDAENWHWQGQTNDCAVVSQEMILDSFGKEFGIDFTQEQLVEIASANGWYDNGTPMMHMGSLLEAHGIPVEQGFGGTLETLSERLEQGEKVIVSLDADEIWTSEQDAAWEDYQGDSIPGQDPNHAVQVIGIDYSNPDSPMVILNDPGHPEGGEMKIPAEQFINAWDDSGNYMVATAVKGTNPENFLVATPDKNTSVPIIAGSHDRYGNWHWDDGTIEPGYNWDTGYV